MRYDDEPCRCIPTAETAGVRLIPTSAIHKLGVIPLAFLFFCGKPTQEMIMKKIAAVFALMFAAGLMGGCNTIEGAGKDIERGGEKIQGTAKDVKQKM
jgi:entericidin B